MEAARFERIVAGFGMLRVVLVGDVALDRYLDIDPALAEVSLETGLPVHNVIRIRPQPGGGGNVLANLAVLMPAHLAAVGVCGDDGEGLELRRALGAMGADLTHFLIRQDRMTFTYTKPLIVRPGRPPEELSRLDIRSRTPTPSDLEERIIEHLRQAVELADVVIAMDQAPDPAAGVLTRRVKSALGDVAAARSHKVFLADSRTAVGDFANVRIKVNRAELARRFDCRDAEVDVQGLALRWSAQIGCDVFVTLGSDGIVAAGGGRVRHVPGLPVEPPIDVTGAGDTVLAWLAAAMGAGAEAVEAAELANLAGSIVVKKLGTTGTASVAEVRSALARGYRS